MDSYEDDDKSVLIGDIQDLDVNEFFESEEEENVVEEAEETKEAESGNEKDPKPRKPKKTVQNPQPKLNFEALQSSKGLIALNKQLEKFKFKGDRHEKEDLAEIMKLLEQWAYRLYPKFHFEDSLQRLESLGKKKIVQTYLKKLRLGMADGDDVICQQDDGDSGESDPEIIPPENENIEQNEFDMLLSQEVEKNVDPQKITLTEDQIRLIELKRKQAMEKRISKMREINGETGSRQDRTQDSENEGIADLR